MKGLIVPVNWVGVYGLTELLYLGISLWGTQRNMVLPEGPGQSNSNLWFTSPDKIEKLGPATATGPIWLDEKVEVGKYSAPFLFNGWSQRCIWIQNTAQYPVSFEFEIDVLGNGNWQRFKKITLAAKSDSLVNLDKSEIGEWIRALTDRDAQLTSSFSYTDGNAHPNDPTMFKGLTTIDQSVSSGGLMYGLPDNRRALGIAATTFV